MYNTIAPQVPKGQRGMEAPALYMYQPLPHLLVCSAGGLPVAAACFSENQEAAAMLVESVFSRLVMVCGSSNSSAAPPPPEAAKCASRAARVCMVHKACISVASSVPPLLPLCFPHWGAGELSSWRPNQQ